MRTVAQAARDLARLPTPEAVTHSWFQTTITREKPAPRRTHADRVEVGIGRRLRGSKRFATSIGPWRHNLTTDTAVGYTNRRDWQAKAMGMGCSFAFATATGAATSVTATTLTNTGAAFTTTGQGLAGQIVACGPNSSGTGSTVYGRIKSNTATVLTVDQWYNPASASGAAGTAPNGTCTYQILPGQAPAEWIAVTEDATAVTSADTALAVELAASGFSRAVGTYAHTAAATTYTLVKLFTATGTVTIRNGALFGGCNVTGAGVMPFTAAEPSPPTLISGDTLQQTCTVTIN